MLENREWFVTFQHMSSRYHIYTQLVSLNYFMTLGKDCFNPLCHIYSSISKTDVIPLPLQILPSPIYKKELPKILARAKPDLCQLYSLCHRPLLAAGLLLLFYYQIHNIL